MYRYFKEVLVIGTFIISCLFAGYAHKDLKTFYGDGLGYYLYLPATFIHADYKNIYEEPKDMELPSSVIWYFEQQRTQAVRTADGHALNQYTYGTALMELPFFLIAYAYESWQAAPNTGYSTVYAYALKASTLFYSLAGLLLIFIILKRYFSSNQALLSVVLIFIGSNLLWFTLRQFGMAHIPIFFLYALLLLLTMKVHEQPSRRLFIAIGFITGLITIIRPADVICLFIPFLYGVYNKDSLKTKRAFLKQHRAKLGIAMLCFIIPIIPQLCYWKALTGSYFFDSYGGNQQFYWLSPKIIPGLFEGRNGWLAYTPLMYLSLIGLLLYKRINKWALVILITLPLYIYITYSWFCFNYINGFGSRPMIHLYPLLALPLGAVIAFIARRGVWIKTIFAILCFFFITVNISYSVQQIMGILHSEESNMTYNRLIFLKNKISYNDFVSLDTGEKQPDKDQITPITVIGCLDLNDPLSESYVADSWTGHGFVYHIKEEYPPLSITTAYHKAIFKDAKWLKGSGRFMCPTYPDYYQQLLLIQIKREGKQYKWIKCQIEGKIGLADSSCEHKEIFLDHYEQDRWGLVYFFVKIPDDIQEGDEISLSMWNIGKRELFADDLCLELYR